MFDQTIPSTYMKLTAVKNQLNEYKKYFGVNRLTRPPVMAWAKKQRQFKCKQGIDLPQMTTDDEEKGEKGMEKLVNKDINTMN